MTDTSGIDQPAAASAPFWDGLSLTKFRAPRQRRDLVARAALVQRACFMALDRPVTLVCAPAGFGKSTVLMQLAESVADRARVQWLSLDGDDNDINRFFVSILSALRDVTLDWAVAPPLLASQVKGPGLETRAALATVANALDSFRGDRLILILDDLHCVTDPDALQLLADLIERLPPNVGVVLGSRLQPALPLARWRVRGDMWELLHADLQFDSADAQALADARQASGLSPALTPEFIDQALQRTQGWVAGLSLVFGVSSGQLVEHLQSAVDKAASRHLFDFFAQEVLAELPADLAEFVLQCSVLPELTPVLCQAVTGRQDVQAVLEDLYRRNLFLTALDETLPVLRFHDLFADFLQNRLERVHPGLAEALHAQAAAAEQVPLRAVSHWLKARRWDEAVFEISRCAEPLLAEGGLALVQRWIVQMPVTGSESRPDLARLNALCSWSGWDFDQAALWLERACTGFQQQGRKAEYMHNAVLLPRAYNAVGRLEDANRALARLATLPLALPHQVICASARAWQDLAIGSPETVATHLDFIATQAEANPALLQPAIDDMFNSFLFGLAGVEQPLLRLQRICLAEMAQGRASWQMEAFALTIWLTFWHGERTAVRAAVMRQTALQEHLSMVPRLSLNVCHSLAWEAAALGDLASALSWQQATLDALDDLQVPGLVNTWRRATLQNKAYMHWLDQDLTALQALWPQLSTDRASVEWPFVATGQVLLQGLIALLQGDLAAAETALLEAEQRQQRWPMPTFFGDARFGIARLRLLQQRPDLAWQTIQPVLQNALREDRIGPLLTAHIGTVDALLELIPVTERSGYQPLLLRLADWRQPASDTETAVETERTVPGFLHPLVQGLSEREREVLAHLGAGDSNKIIARALNLSPHTVKRHVANILDKLDCASRGQAAALWRSNQPN